MELNIRKLERQKQGCLKFFNSSQYGSPKNYWGILNYETGVGKTLTAQLAIQLMLKKNNSLRVTILSPTKVVNDMWKETTPLVVAEEHLENITYFSAKEFLDSGLRYSTDLLVIDEIHKFYTEEMYKIIKSQISYKYCLGLTATPFHPKGLHSKVLSFIPIIDSIDQKEALKEGFISKFIEYNLAVNLTVDEYNDYNFLTEKIKQYTSKFGRQGFELAQKVLNGDGQYTAFQYALGWASHKGWRKDLNWNRPEDEAILREWSPNVVIGYAKELFNAIRERTTLLYSCDEKLTTTVDIVKKFDKVKTICFGQSTTFADNLNTLINRELPNQSVVYHSKLQTRLVELPNGKTKKVGKTVLMREAIEAIKTNKARIICSASALDTGFDVKDISLGIICAGTQNPTQSKQRGGRVVRLEEIYQTDTPVLIINLYVPESRDEEWLKKRQSRNSHIVYWIESLEQISFNPQIENEYDFSMI